MVWRPRISEIAPNAAGRTWPSPRLGGSALMLTLARWPTTWSHEPATPSQAGLTYRSEYSDSATGSDESCGKSFWTEWTRTMAASDVCSQRSWNAALQHPSSTTSWLASMLHGTVRGAGAATRSRMPTWRSPPATSMCSALCLSKQSTMTSRRARGSATGWSGYSAPTRITPTLRPASRPGPLRRAVLLPAPPYSPAQPSSRPSPTKNETPSSRPSPRRCGCVRAKGGWIATTTASWKSVVWHRKSAGSWPTRFIRPTRRRGWCTSWIASSPMPRRTVKLSEAPQTP